MRGAAKDLRAVAHPGRVERPGHLGDLLGGHAAVVVGKAEVDLGGQAPSTAMGAVGIVAHEPADVKAPERGDAFRVRGGDAPADSPAHAVAGDRDRAAADLLQPVEVGTAVADDSLRRQLADQRHDSREHCGALLGIAKTVERDHRRAAGTVEDVGRENHEAPGRDPVGHLLDLRTQTVRIHHQHHARTTLLVGPRNVGIGDAVRCRDVDHRTAHRSAPLATPPVRRPTLSPG